MFPSKSGIIRSSPWNHPEVSGLYPFWTNKRPVIFNAWNNAFCGVIILVYAHLDYKNVWLYLLVIYVASWKCLPLWLTSHTKKKFLLPCLIARGQTSLTMCKTSHWPMAKRVVKPEFDRDNPERRFCTRNEDFTTQMTRCLPNDQEITMLSLGWAPSTFKRMNLTVVSATN